MAVNTITGQESCGGPHAHSFRDLWSVASVFLSPADIFRFGRASECNDTCMWYMHVTCALIYAWPMSVMRCQVFCMWLSVVCTRIYQHFFLNVLLPVLLTMSWSGQWHAPCHLSHQACRQSLCMGFRWIGLCSKPHSRRPRKGSPPPCLSQPKFPPWSQQAKLCCFGFYRTVRVHSHWTCRPSLRHPRASHPTPPQLPHRFLPQLPVPPSWAMLALGSTAPPPA